MVGLGALLRESPKPPSVWLGETSFLFLHLLHLLASGAAIAKSFLSAHDLKEKWQHSRFFQLSPWPEIRVKGRSSLPGRVDVKRHESSIHNESRLTLVRYLFSQTHNAQTL